jgi:hypothetical protein
MKRDLIMPQQIDDLVEMFGYDATLLRPTVDEIIDYLRDNYQIVIYERVEPCVDPTTHRIMFSLGVKWCNLRDGWNGRVYIGQTEMNPDIYESKRCAISLALDWLKNKNYGKEKESL